MMSPVSVMLDRHAHDRSWKDALLPAKKLSLPVIDTRKASAKMALLAIMVVIVVIGALIATPAMIRGATADTAEQFRANAAQDLTVEEEKELVLAASASPAADFITAMEEYVPEGHKIIAVKNGTANSLVSWICPNLSINPHPVLGTQVELSNGVTVTVSAFGAGQSAKARVSYRDGLRNCTGRNGSAGLISGSAPMAVGDYNGFSFASGGVSTNVWLHSDVMVTVSARDRNVVRNMSVAYRNKINSELEASTCLDARVTRDDANRSPYYGADNYTGWERGREVALEDAEPGITAGVYAPGAPFDGSGKRLGAYAHQEGPTGLLERPDAPAKPESPLPAGVPANLPNAVPQPDTQITSVKSRPEPTTTVPERVEDPEGPGCGWAWTGQKAPIFDASEEKARADEAARKEVQRMREEYGEYQASVVANHNTTLQYNREADEYNAYVESYDTVAEQWEDINRKRSEYRERLDQYWEDMEAYENFEADLEEAQTAYDEDVQECRDNPTVTEERLVTPEPAPAPTPQPSDGGGESPTPTPTPEVEEVEVPNPECPADRPEILDQQAPSVPTPPTKPDVPLPSSWTDVP